RTSILAPIGLLTAILLWICIKQYRAHKSAYLAQASSPERLRSGRLFNIINIGQWIVIIVAINVLQKMGHGQWITPAIISIVGLHFFPLAVVFNYKPHYLTGLGLVLVAAAYPLYPVGGPAYPLGCLGAGVILWLSAFRSISFKAPLQSAISQP
ncbi:MAG: hypothetical protein ABIT64_00035, partial [Lysobacteraceae bacterium]